MNGTPKLRPLTSMTVVLVVTLLSCLAVAQANAGAGTVLMPEGTEVSLEFAESVSSRTAAEGDRITLRLLDDLKVGSAIVARAGAPATGVVTSVRKAGYMGKGGELNVRLEYLKVGETRVRLRANKGHEGASKVGAAVALTVLFGPVGLLKRGHNIDIKEGMPLTAVLEEDVTLPVIASIGATADANTSPEATKPGEAFHVAEMSTQPGTLDDYAKAKGAMSDLRALATAIEAFATDHNEYPGATLSSALKALISPTYIRTMPEVDPWESPYLYVVSEDRRSYRIVSAAADRRFSARWDFVSMPLLSPRLVPNLDGDIVFENGLFVRHPDEPQELVEQRRAVSEALKGSNPRRYTMDRMLMLTTATEAWGTDNDGLYPNATTVAALRVFLEPTYIREAPITDAWDTMLRYEASPDGKHVRFISAGPDRRFDNLSAGSDDIVWEDGEFVTP